ncbi:MAG: lamin tail domain-containing protein, partial [Myxococcales bacterium]|nr:lamin tail domain-containing protein [Myxococcales bacterium]
YNTAYLTDGDGNVYGAFEPLGRDRWGLDLTWAQAHAVAPIEFADGAGQDRALRAVFFDEGGRRGEAAVTLRLTCGASGACAGECVQTDRDVRHCGGCGVSCDPGEACQGGACAAPGTVIVSEFMPDPRVVTDNDGEYIELHNPGGAAVNLQGWTIGELADIQAGEGDFFVVEAPLVVAPGGYTIIARSLDPATNGGLAANYAARFSLRNGEDTIAVFNPLGEQVDLVAYDAGFGWAAGVAAHLRPGAQRTPAGNDGAAAWCGAPDPYGPGDNRGSPGAQARGCR